MVDRLHTRDNPLLAPVTEKRPLTRDVSSKLTLHLALSTENGDLPYEVGDSCGVIAHNDPGHVEEILTALKFTGEEPVTLGKAAPVTLRHALTHQLLVTQLTRKMVNAYATKGQCAHLLGLLVPEQQQHLETYTWGRGLIDLLEEFPGVMADPQEVVAMLPRLSPRLYSISSSPKVHTGEVHTTVAVVRYHTYNRERGGVATTYMGDRTEVGDRLPIYIQANKKFRLPEDPDASIIMIGPGTGVAPFRAFLHERRALGARGRNWLFFGERSAASDFLYKEDWEQMLADGHLTRLDTAFSRDQAHKVYVQDRMKEKAADFWAWLEEGATLYVCGDANHMAKDVDAMLLTIAQQQGKLDHDAALEYVHQLKVGHRYHRDVY